MRIAQITPGVIPIPPNGWGAVEKIIWEYTKVLRSLGHEVEILYADDVKPGEWDIVHVHMANLALSLKERGIPYVFSHHDHHAYHYGKGSQVYEANKEAIEGSILSFVHAKYLIEYFGSPHQLRYLGHGANIHDYEFLDRSKSILKQSPKLIMMAHNGILGDPNFDRKGFIPGILASKKLGLPLTIICPRNVNQEFFLKNSEVSSYRNLKILYDINYEDSLKELNEHHIFLNPGILEAGHPNLTVAENICMGLPVVGTMESDLPGMRRVKYSGSVDPDDLAAGISDVINGYSSYVLQCKEQRPLLSWEVVVSRMLMDYAVFGKVGQRKLLLDNYTSVSKVNRERKEDSGYYCHFNRDPYFYKGTCPPDFGGSVIFKDTKTNTVRGVLNSNTGRSWVRLADNPSVYSEWEIQIKKGSEVLKSIKMDLQDQHVLIEPGKILSENVSDIIDKFIYLNGCIPTLTGNIPDIKTKHFRIQNPDQNSFYRILNTDQIIDYFSPAIKKEEHHLLFLRTETLGDTIGFMPYAQEYAKRKGIRVSVSNSFDFLFDKIYDGIEQVSRNVDFSLYSDVIFLDYIYDLPLQLGFANQLGMDDAGYLRPTIVKSGKTRPISKKYVCFSMHSTTQAKFWNNNNSWENLCVMLSEEGYLPVCIDRYQSFGIEGSWNNIPPNCLNKTGGDLSSMIEWIEHCEFFVGLSSGLSWVAHALGKKVVMISGVTLKNNEFLEDCIRIHRDDVCNSCFNYPEKYPFNPGDWHWCPLHKGTNRAYECTKKISAKQVMDKIRENRWI